MTTQSELEQIVAELVAGIEARDAQREPGTFSTAEFAKVMGCSTTKALAICHELKDQEKLQTVVFTKINDWGRKSSVQGWRTVEPVKKKGRK